MVRQDRDVGIDGGRIRPASLDGQGAIDREANVVRHGQIDPCAGLLLFQPERPDFAIRPSQHGPIVRGDVGRAPPVEVGQRAQVSGALHEVEAKPHGERRAMPFLLESVGGDRLDHFGLDPLASALRLGDVEALRRILAPFDQSMKFGPARHD